MRAKDRAYILFIAAGWQPGDPLLVGSGLTEQPGPGLGSSVVLARSGGDGVPLVIGFGRVTAMRETADEAGIELLLRSVRLLREPRWLTDLTPNDDGTVTLGVLERILAEDEFVEEFDEPPQGGFTGFGEAVLHEALHANGWRCQLTGQPIPRGARPESHVAMIVPEAFDGVLRPDNLLTLSLDAASAWRAGAISANVDGSIVVNTGGVTGTLYAQLGTAISVPSEDFRPNPVYVRYHRYRIFDRVPSLH